MASKALESAVRAVMDAMPTYGNRMTYAHIKVVLGWPKGYYNITLLAKTLVERGLARSVKREEDRLRHLEVVPPGQREAARAAAQVPAAPRVPATVVQWGSDSDRYVASQNAQRAAAEAARTARYDEEEARAVALRRELREQEEAARDDRRRAAIEEEQRERRRQEAEQAKVAFSAPIKGNGAGQCQGAPALVLDDTCGAEVYGAWGARKPAAS